jgi:hypothetical protein
VLTLDNSYRVACHYLAYGWLSAPADLRPLKDWLGFKYHEDNNTNRVLKMRSEIMEGVFITDNAERLQLSTSVLAEKVCVIQDFMASGRLDHMFGTYALKYPQAMRLFQEGKSLRDAGQGKAAIPKFVEAYSIVSGRVEDEGEKDDGGENDDGEDESDDDEDESDDDEDDGANVATILRLTTRWGMTPETATQVATWESKRIKALTGTGMTVEGAVDFIYSRVPENTS